MTRLKRPAIPPATRIREIRKARGFTLLQLANAVGTTPQTMQRLETGNMTVTVEWLDKIGRALGLKTYDLLPHHEVDASPEHAFTRELRDAFIRNRRHLMDIADVPLAMVEASGKLAGMLLECRKGLRPWGDAREAALAVAACAMRLGLEAEVEKKAGGAPVTLGVVA
jgi:transcriptional regulator with XRE-family HTH domain